MKTLELTKLEIEEVFELVYNEKARVETQLKIIDSLHMHTQESRMKYLSMNRNFKNKIRRYDKTLKKLIKLR